MGMRLPPLQGAHEWRHGLNVPAHAAASAQRPTETSCADPRALPVSLSLLCYGEPGAAGFMTPDPVPRPRCSVLCYAAAWARARGLRTSGAHLGVCVRVEPWHWSLSSPPAPPNWGGSHGPDGYATLRRARGPAEWRGGRDAVPEGRGGRASSVSTRRVCGC